MAYDPSRHHRRSIRLAGYDYTRPGAYFITFCVQGQRWLLGHVSGGCLDLSPAGKMAVDWWQRLPEKFPSLALDAFVVMPNHVHGIVLLGELADASARRPALGDVVRWYKTMTTNAYINGVRQQRWPTFDRRLWHRNYYEHIVRDEDALGRIRAYIAANPARWCRDRFASAEVPARTRPR